jgi:hypothetical protein
MMDNLLIQKQGNAQKYVQQDYSGTTLQNLRRYLPKKSINIR